jgi:hypothetical protein
MMILRQSAGLCCVAGSGEARSRPNVVSDRSGGFRQHRGDPQDRAGVDSEFVVAARILQKSVASDHPARDG